MKVAAGADFIQTQGIYDVGLFRSQMKKAADLGCFEHTAMLAGIIVPKSAMMLKYPAWMARYGACVRGLSHCNLQREERLAIEEHARTSGCRLIVNPHIRYEMYGQSARIARLESLLEFLESMPDSLCQVVISPTMDHDQSLTILGDWFTADSVSARIGEGFRQTVFTRHAPSRQKKIEAFDQEFSEHLRALAWTPETSRARAIVKIREIVDDLTRNTK